jgi:hypothetical protein
MPAQKAPDPYAVYILIETFAMPSAPLVLLDSFFAIQGIVQLLQ